MRQYCIWSKKEICSHPRAAADTNTKTMITTT